MGDGVEAYFDVLLTSALGVGSGQLYAPSILLLLPIGEEAGRVLEPVWLLCIRNLLLLQKENPVLCCPSHILDAIYSLSYPGSYM
jgi:hypothetical protein